MLNGFIPKTTKLLAELGDFDKKYDNIEYMCHPTFDKEDNLVDAVTGREIVKRSDNLINYRQL